MVEVVELSVRARDGSGRGAARALRRSGQIPGVVYGGAKSPDHVAVDVAALRKEVERGGFSNRLVDLAGPGGSERVLPREVQLHPVTDQPLHVDFLRLSPTSQVRLAVPVHFEAEELSPGIRRGGLVNIVRHDVELHCRADSIPEYLTASLAGLEIGDSVRISDIVLPQNVRPAITDRDFTIATIAAPTVIRDEALGTTEAEDSEAVEAAEGAAADGKGDGAEG